MAQQPQPQAAAAEQLQLQPSAAEPQEEPQFPQVLGPLLVHRCNTLPAVKGQEWRFPLVQPLQPLSDAGIRCSGKLSPRGPIPAVMLSLGLPPGSVQLAWAYPDDDIADVDGNTRARLESVPEVDFVQFGGFVFFDQHGACLHATSIRSRGSQWGESAALWFDGPFSWPPTRTTPLHNQGRFRPISIKQLRAKGARWFCFLLPGEQLGVGGVSCPGGGFVYLFSDDVSKSSPSDCYFQLVSVGQPGAPGLTTHMPHKLERFELVDFNSKQGQNVVLRHNRLKYNRLTLLAVPSMMPLAREMHEAAPGLVMISEIEFASFPDGTPNLFVNPALVNGYDVVLLVDYDIHRGGVEWLHNLSLIYEIPRYGARSLTVVLPFYPVGTMERISVEGEIPTAMSFARMLSATPMTTQGPPRFVFFDIHALQNRFYFSDRVMPHLATAIPLLRKEMEEMERQGSGDRVAVVFPDDGAKKRFGPLFTIRGSGGTKVEAYPLIVCSKVRGSGAERRLRVTEGKEAVKGRHCIIVDDLVQSGGTMIGCKDLLFELGAAKVTGFVTHGVFPRGSWKRFLSCNTPPDKKPWTSFIITNSVPGTVAQVKGQAPFRVLSLAPRIIDLLGGVAPAKPATWAEETMPTGHASPIPAHRSAL
eukprot:TRINITY_DN2855_c0_g3_i1.p1 TRINITY_DN2855_c0_g3~~TRINITY_DN2855_c0_g3_i1.p1  ORF type:complete len:668 (+),score=208.01 TRINITY_DN2855_c0_g3_i1:73-2004(+)